LKHIDDALEPIVRYVRLGRIHKCAPGPDRHNIRSATPMGFARAVFEANGKALREGVV